MLKKMTIGSKILGGFGLAGGLLVVLLALAVTSLYNLTDAVGTFATARMPNLRDVATINEAQTDVALVVYGLANEEIQGEPRSELYAEAQGAFKRMDESWIAFDQRSKAPRTTELFNALKEPWAAWRRAAEQALALEKERDGAGSPDSPAYQAVTKRIQDALLAHRGAYRSADRAIEELQRWTNDLATGEGEKAAAQGRSATVALPGALLVIILLVFAIGLLIAKDVRQVLAAIGGNLDQIAGGRLPPPLAEERGADLNAVRDSLNTVIGTIQGLLAEMNRMSGEHEKGDIDVVIDVARFEGAYRTMAEGINTMVASHIAVKRQAMGVVGEFGRGNLEAPMPLLPGKKRFINETIERVRGNLKALIAELTRMSAEHEKGDIDVVIDAAKFEGAYRIMAEGINAMVGSHIAAKKLAMGVVGEFGRGNFEASMPLLPGKKRFINETIEQVRGHLKALIADTGALAKAAVEGRLEARADPTKHQGDYRKILQGVNDTLDAIIAPIRELAATLDKLAAGDLSARTDPSRYQNESRKHLEAVNVTLGALLAPVNEASTVLEKLAKRDFRARVTGRFQGDHARLADALNSTAEALNEALAQVSGSVDQVSSAATQIASSSQAVASGASEQASALEETGSALESVASMARQSAESAQQASLLAVSARSAASDGETAVEQLQGAMGRIKHSAEGTSQIIKDVSEIAFQTNLLALNAAVEAARAGEAGRGFAVVAEEVRSLALRAKEAASKTEELIRQSVREAGEGEVAAKRVAEKLGEIVQGVSKVTDLVAEIASASKEQTAGIAQVNTAVVEMDKVTQQNAASAEQSSSAASELSGQSEELASMVATFQLVQRARPDVNPREALALRSPRTAAAKRRGVRTDAGEQAPRGKALGGDFPMDNDEARDF